MDTKAILLFSTLILAGCVSGQQSNPPGPDWMSKRPWAQPQAYNDISHTGEIVLGWRLNAKVIHDQTILVEIINETKQDKDLGENDGNEYPLSSWYFIAKGPNGKLMPFTVYYKSVPKPWEPSPKPFTGTLSLPFVKPGKKVTCQFDLNRLFDLSEPGKYQIYVKRVFSRMTQVKWGTSNKIEVSTARYNDGKLEVHNE